VSDVFIMPSAHRIGSREAIRFPDWGEAPLSAEAGATLDAVSLAMIERSHALFCPSQSVIDDVATYIPSARAKCRLVRYGSSLSFPEPSRTVPKRILFAGTITLRKGPQYLKLVADRIARLDPEIRFVFAGGASETAMNQLRGPNVELLGHVSRERMREEFLRADLFAFPSLAEGSAGVVLEAMAAGLPIVATREAGVEFADRESGIIVPPTNVEALEEAILAIVRNRSLRQKMACSARAEFNAYDDRTWAAAFLGALRDVAAGR
jgi:glycosyltransferase involved in cell wall biosynthesis